MTRRQRTAPSRRPPTSVGLIVVMTAVVCLVNSAFSIQATRRLGGADPDELERRYGSLRPMLESVRRAVYLSDARWRFVEARYVLAPVVLDPGYVVLQVDRRSIETFALDVLVADAAARPPMMVLCDFDHRSALDAVLDELAAEAGRRGLETRLISRGGGLALVSVGG